MARPNKGPQLKKNDFGVWEIRWSEHGRSRRRSTGETDHSNAQKVLAQFLLLSGHETKSEYTVSDLITLYWDEHGEGRPGSKSLRCDLNNLDDFFGVFLPEEIAPGHVKRFDKQHSWKPGTLRKHLGRLSAVINYGVTTRRISKRQVPYIPKPAPTPSKDRWLTRKEAAEIRKAIRECHGGERIGRVERFMMLALHTASRRAALEQLTWFQVDFDQRMIRLGERGRAETTKRRANVPMNDEIYAFLKECQREANTEFVLDHPGDMYMSFCRPVRKAGYHDVTPHTLRHTAATWMAQDRVDLWQIAGFLGDTMTTVERNYAHHHPDYLKGAANALMGRAESGQ